MVNIMSLKDKFKAWLQDQRRWRIFMWNWDKSPSIKNKLSSLIVLFNGLPNMLFPFKVRNSTGQWVRWEAAYDELTKEAEKKYPDGADSFKEPRIFWWRQCFHLLGGFALGLANIPLLILLWMMVIMTIPFWALGLLWSMYAVSWLTLLTVWAGCIIAIVR